MNETQKFKQIQTWLLKHGEPSYRLRQIEQAWFRVSDWSHVHVLTPRMREQLSAVFPWTTITTSSIFTSQRDGTQKAIVTFHDGQSTETVLMPNARGRATVCVSSQIGCGMKCVFCATGSLGLKRNLTSDEIIDQLRFWKMKRPKTNISNVVMMGMGEPLANFDHVKSALRIMIDNMDIGPTRITLSTVGFRAGLKRLLDDADFPPVRLALSLHAATDTARRSIVPSHAGTTIKDLKAFAKEYIESKSNRRHHLTLEVVMLEGINDTPELARALVKFCSSIRHRLKVNLIPWNPTTAPLHRSPTERLLAFQTILKNAGITATIRYSKGLDIAGACGQLALRNQGSKM